MEYENEIRIWIEELRELEELDPPPYHGPTDHTQNDL